MYRLLFFILIFSDCLFAQVTNRYPYIQRPSQTSATIAWRRATAGIGTLYLGVNKSVWTDSLSSPTPEQKPFFNLTGLVPNQKYYYQCKSISQTDSFYSSIDSFYTAPIDLTPNLSFLAYGDCGYNNLTQNTVKALMEQETVDFAIVTGDVDQGVGDNYDNVFFGVYKDMLKKSCHFTCIGNHDTYADGAATYLDAFYLPSNNSQNSERYYSFVWGDAKFICLDANIAYNNGSPQFNWMVEEMKCNDKKWLFVFFHQPPWTNAWSADYYLPFSPYFLYQGNVDMRSSLVPEFERYKVDFVVNGHSHCYQRGALNGVQYLITGGAGASTLDANKHTGSPNISREIYENHYVRFDIKGDTAKYIMINSLGQLRDSVQVVKAYQHFNLTANIQDASCFGLNNATIQTAVNGPSYRLPYTFLWSNGSSTNNLGQLFAGTYSLSVTDALGCVRDTILEVFEPSRVSTTIVSSTGVPVICDNNPITLSTQASFFSYLWNNGSTNSTLQVSAPGVYTVVVTDSNLCDSDPIQIQIGNGFTPDSTQIQIQINGLTVSILNSNSAYFVWNFGDGTAGTNQVAPIHTYNQPGTYLIVATVLNACGVDSFYFSATVSPSSVTYDDKLLDLFVSPNPVGENIYVFCNEEQTPLFFKLYDMNGKFVREWEPTAERAVVLPRGGLPAGYYMLRVEATYKAKSIRILLK